MRGQISLKGDLEPLIIAGLLATMCFSYSAPSLTRAAARRQKRGKRKHRSLVSKMHIRRFSGPCARSFLLRQSGIFNMEWCQGKHHHVLAVDASAGSVRPCGARPEITRLG